MKQIAECLEKAFNNKLPALSKKWKGFIEYRDGKRYLFLFHYHHLVLVYDCDNHIFVKEWWEKPTDKRGLDSAKKWLEENRHKYGQNLA